MTNKTHTRARTYPGEWSYTDGDPANTKRTTTAGDETFLFSPFLTGGARGRKSVSGILTRGDGAGGRRHRRRRGRCAPSPYDGRGKTAPEGTPRT